MFIEGDNGPFYTFYRTGEIPWRQRETRTKSLWLEKNTKNKESKEKHEQSRDQKKNKGNVC